MSVKEEVFKVIKIHSGRNYNAIDISVGESTYQITVDKNIELNKDLIDKTVKINHKKIDENYIFDIVDYKINVIK